MDNFKKRWKQFASIVFDPWILLLLVFTIIIVSYDGSGQVNESGKYALVLIQSISAAVLGGVVTKRWLDLQEEAVLTTRARTAVRGLKLLLGNLVALQSSLS